MAKPLTDDEIEAIVADIRAEMPRNEIARKHGRAAGTISKIAADNDLSFDRSATKTATAAAVVDLRARRVAILGRLYSLAEHELGRLEALNDGARYRLVMGTGSGKAIDREVTTAPERCRVEIATQMGIHLDKAKMLEQMDTADDHSGARGLLERLVAGLEDVAA